MPPRHILTARPRPIITACTLTGRTRPGDITSLLQKRGLAFVSFADWQILEQIENERGILRGQPRVKITDVDEMLRLIQSAKKEAAALPS